MSAESKRSKLANSQARHSLRAAPGSAVLRAAIRLRKIKRKAAEADAAFKRLMEARYGEHDEMPDALVEIIEYPNGPDSALTIEFIDSEMTEAGYPPNSLLDEPIPEAARVNEMDKNA